jgi:hypothetical protein
LTHRPEEPQTIRFELPKKPVFSNKSIETLNWEERNELMQEIFKCRAYGIKKPVGPDWETYDEYDEEDEDWYRIEEGKKMSKSNVVLDLFL